MEFKSFSLTRFVVIRISWCYDYQLHVQSGIIAAVKIAFVLRKIFSLALFILTAIFAICLNFIFIWQKYLFILKLRVCFAGKHKKALLFYRETFNYPDFGGRSSRNEARFSGVTRKVLSYSEYTLPCSCEHQVWSGSIHLERLKTYFAVFRRTQLDCGNCCYCPSVFWRGYW
jgi:hypothetical protein